MSLVVIVEGEGQQPLVMDPDERSELIPQRWAEATGQDPSLFVFTDSDGAPLADDVTVDKLPKASPTCVKIGITSKAAEPVRSTDINADLAAAVTSGDLYKIQELLDNGADCNTLGPNGLAPLHLAAIEDNIESIEILIDHGASLDFPSTNFHCPLTAPPPNPSPSLPMLSSATADDTKGASAVHIAASLGHTDALKTLLDQGARLETVDAGGRTPLAYAATSGQVQSAKHLLDRGCHIDSRDKLHRTPLFAAVRENHPSMVRLLLQYGADVEVRDINGLRPIHEAVAAAIATGMQEPLDLLLDTGAEVNVTSRDGRKPMEMAQTAGADVKIMSALKAAKDRRNGKRCSFFCIRC